MHGPPRLARLATAIALAVVVASSAFAAAAAGAGPALSAPQAIRETRQVVVRWTADELGATRAARLASLGDARLVGRLSHAAGMRATFVRPFGDAGTMGVYRFQQPLGVAANRTIAGLNAVSGVAYAEADPIATIDALPSDPFADKLWGQLGPSGTPRRGAGPAPPGIRAARCARPPRPVDGQATRSRDARSRS
jgi:hypothetical protein